METLTVAVWCTQAQSPKLLFYVKKEIFATKKTILESSSIWGWAGRKEPL